MAKSKPKPDAVVKTGRLSKDDMTYILANAGKIPIELIAKNLGRRPVSIEAVIRKNNLIPTVGPASTQPSVATEARQSLRSSELWKRIAQEFSQDERRFFEEQYKKLMQQFEGNVLPSEEMQVFDCIKLEILKSRNLIERQKARLALAELERQRESLLGGRLSSMLDPDELKSLAKVSSEIRAKEGTEKDKTTEYTMLVQRQESIMKSLKSTRDQRINEISSGKSTFHGLIKTLQSKEMQLFESRQAELHRMAAMEEMRRLAQEKIYEDGQVDRPILSADTVLGQFNQDEVSEEGFGNG